MSLAGEVWGLNEARELFLTTILVFGQTKWSMASKNYKFRDDNSFLH